MQIFALEAKRGFCVFAKARAMLPLPAAQELRCKAWGEQGQ